MIGDKIWELGRRCCGKSWDTFAHHASLAARVAIVLAILVPILGLFRVTNCFCEPSSQNLGTNRTLGALYRNDRGWRTIRVYLWAGECGCGFPFFLPPSDWRWPWKTMMRGFSLKSEAKTIGGNQ